MLRYEKVCEGESSRIAKSAGRVTTRLSSSLSACVRILKTVGGRICSICYVTTSMTVHERMRLDLIPDKAQQSPF
jgi:hypothetical protein